MQEEKEVKINVVNDDDDKQYTICCSHSSVGFIKYSSAFVISLGILTFSFIMIGMHPTSDNTIYFSLISAIMTLFINPPNIHH
jgi:hypothetical protein